MSKKAKGDKGKNARNGNRLSSSQGVLTTMAQVSHLDGLSEKHFDDVAAARRQRSPEDIKVDLAEAALFEAYYKGTGPRPDLVTNIWFGDCGAGHVAPDGHDGSAVVMPGAMWQDLIERADTSRREWRDAEGRKRQSAEDRELSGQLRKIFARLPPWLAVEAGKEISREQVVAAVTQLVIEFQIETGRRVLAANIHIESNHDIHVHLSHTALVPVKSDEGKYTSDYLAKLLTKQRGQARAELVTRNGIKPSLKEVRTELERLWESGTLENPNGDKAFYQRLTRPKDARRYMKSMNQPYCSKATLWEADGRSQRVAQVNEQEGHHFTFDAVVVDAARRADLAESPKGKPTGPENIYIDYWLAKRWTNAINLQLPPESQTRAMESAKDYVERYVRDGSSLPNPALDAAREKAAGEIAVREAEVEKREDVVTSAEETLSAGIEELAKGKSDLAVKISDFEESKKDIETARAALRKIPLDELCTKLGFATDDQRNLRLDISNDYAPIPHRVLHTGQAFRLESYHMVRHEWSKVGSGNGAIDLVMALPPKPSLMDACGKLAALFPDQVGGLTLEVLEHKARQLQKGGIGEPQSPDQDPKR